jgi:prepilin peptidase CpaA
MILVALFFTFSLPTSGVWPTFWHVIFASAIFVVILGVYSLGALGGGDVKLLSAAFLWMGAENASLFCILLAAAATAYLIIYRAFRILPIKLNAKGGIMVPYGPCIAAAWIGTEILQMHP